MANGGGQAGKGEREFMNFPDLAALVGRPAQEGVH